MEKNNCKNPQCFCDGSCKGLVKSDINYSMETEKVIEQGKGYLDITHLNKTISIYEKFHSRPEGKTILVDKSKATTVAKAICPKYQETEDENKILKNQIELIFKNANNKIESLEQKNAKLLVALKNTIDHVLNRVMKIDIEATIELIHEAETKLKDNE